MSHAPPPEEPKIEGGKTLFVTHRKKEFGTEIDIEWIKSKPKVSIAVVFLLCSGFKAQVGYSYHLGAIKTNTQCEYQQEICVQYMEAHCGLSQID